MPLETQKGAINKPEDHPLWKWFATLASSNGISLEHEDDWGEWWGCFLAGAKAQYDQTYQEQEEEMDKRVRRDGFHAP